MKYDTTGVGKLSADPWLRFSGVGKSFLLSELIALLDSLGKRYSITAPTGIAALNVDGMTVHSWYALLYYLILLIHERSLIDVVNSPGAE